MIDQRAALERLIKERGEGYAGVSRLLGRNSAFVQQFIKRGSPRRLEQADVERLARYFAVSVSELGGELSEIDSDLVRVPRLDIGASAGFGAHNDRESTLSHIAFDPSWLRQICGSPGASVSFIRVQGDSMTPTLNDGDEILVDQCDSGSRLRDGIYVLRRDDSLIVKRLAINPSSRLATIKSDNPAYPEWRECDLATLDIVGRVVWAGRRVG